MLQLYGRRVRRKQQNVSSLARRASSPSCLSVSHFCDSNLRQFSSSSSSSSSSSNISCNNSNLKVDVCIVGCGPVGAFAAILLGQMGVSHVVLDRRTQPTSHPQAHFINCRSMELMRTEVPVTFNKMLHRYPSSSNWRSFVYCHKVLGREFARIDHFKLSNSDIFWKASPTNVIHLPQNIFEDMLREELKSPTYINNTSVSERNKSSNCNTSYASNSSKTSYSNNIDNSSSHSHPSHLFGYELRDLEAREDGCVVTYTKSLSYNSSSKQSSGGGGEGNLDCANSASAAPLLRRIECKFVIGADGANSLVRQKMGASLTGTQQLQTLINVHFTCKGLAQAYAASNCKDSKLPPPPPAMLHFVFNERVVAVLVAHDPIRDEWVCQLPIFPPYQKLEDFNEQQLKDLIMFSLGGSPHDSNKNSSSKLDINILSKNVWTMNAEVASCYSNRHTNVFLVGDSAHRFPPAGGFGMNTGLQDAHNLAWKLAAVISGSARKALLKSYDGERRPVAEANTRLSVENYKKSENAAAALGVDPKLARLAVNSVTTVSMIDRLSPFSIPASFKKSAVDNILKVGLAPLSLLSDSSRGNLLGEARINKLRRLVDGGESLPLLFPKEDLFYKYSYFFISNNDNSNNNSDSRNRGSGNRNINYGSSNNTKNFDHLEVGRRVPHAWFVVQPDNIYVSSLDIPKLVRPTPNPPHHITPASIMAMTKNVVVLFTVMCSESQHSLWLEVTNRLNLSNKVAVVKIVNRDISSSSESYNCEALQTALQTPFYHVNSDKDDERDSERSHRTCLHEGDGGSIGDITILNLAIPSHTLVDVSGSWAQQMSAASAASIVIRRDGFVALVVKEQDEVETQLRLLMQEYCVVT